jgi:hypothetical protein
MSSSPNHNGSSAKRQKGNDGAVVGFLSSWMGYFTGRRDDSAQHMLARNEKMMERMEELMSKMEEKLESLDDPVDEERHEEGEEEGGEEDYSSEGGSDSDAESVESISTKDLKSKGKALEAYQEMVATNRDDWKYSAEDLNMVDLDGLDLAEDEIESIMHLSQNIKNCTIKMRRGEYTFNHGKNVEYFDQDEFDYQGVRLEPRDLAETYEKIIYIYALRPHWEEFAHALNDFGLILDVMPDGTDPCFQVSQIELPAAIFEMIVKSLKGKGFIKYYFRDNGFGRYGIRALIDLMDSNPELRSLSLYDNSIDEEDGIHFCQAIARHPTLTSIDLAGCCRGRIYMLSELVRSSQLESISMIDSDLSFFTAAEREGFFNALSSNTSLTHLTLTGNNLIDEDAASIATAIEGNNTLQHLCLRENMFTEAAAAYFGYALGTNNTLSSLYLSKRVAERIEIYNALFDNSSLNSAADSNHTCHVVRCGFKACNEEDDPTGNRQRKIYNILASRNKRMSNAQYFDDIDINLLPEILAAVQRYASTPVSERQLLYRVNSEVSGLSIVYELMRKWDSIYKIWDN